MDPDAVFRAGPDPLRAVDFLGDLAPGDVVLLKGHSRRHFERIPMLLDGRTLRCRLPECRTREMTCDQCPALMRGLGNCLLVLVPQG